MRLLVLNSTITWLSACLTPLYLAESMNVNIDMLRSVSVRPCRCGVVCGISLQPALFDLSVENLPVYLSLPVYCDCASRKECLQVIVLLVMWCVMTHQANLADTVCWFLLLSLNWAAHQSSKALAVENHLKNHQQQQTPFVVNVMMFFFCFFFSEKVLD